MKAIVQMEYGTPDVLRLEERPEPTPGPFEVTIRVRAASVNSWDWDNLRGSVQARPFLGLRKPKRHIPGADVAGLVEAVGKAVTRFKPGDEVFGDLCACGWGSFAEYVCAREDALVPKPAGVTFELAAALPQAGVMALQGIRDYGNVARGQRVLINGAGGGVGTFAIQLAKALGAEVTGVDNAAKLDLMRSVGADHVIDYAREDYTDNGQHYDVILDPVAHRSMFDCARAVKRDGIYIAVGGSTARILQLLLVGGWLQLTAKKKLKLLAHEPNKDLAYLGELVQAGALAPAIETYALSDTAEALGRLGRGDVLGKAVITM